MRPGQFEGAHSGREDDGLRACENGAGTRVVGEQTRETEKYKQPSAAATVAVYAKGDNSFLLIKRGHEPFKGRYAFPGGFLDVDKEDLYQTGVRELKEETGLDIRAKDLVLVDVRSSPTRDPRGHVIDVGFLAVIDKALPVGIEGDEAVPEWVRMDMVDKLDFAFDHDVMWKNIKAHLKGISNL